MRVITEVELQTLFEEKGFHFAKYGIQLAVAVEELVLRKIASMQAEAPQATWVACPECLTGFVAEEHPLSEADAARKSQGEAP